MANGKHRESWGDRSFHITNYVVLSLLAIVVLYPLIYVVSASLSSAYAVATKRVWLFPVDVTLDGYKAVFKHSLIMQSFMNSAIYTVGGTCVNVVLLLLAAYPLSRKAFPGKQFVVMYFTFTMFFSGGIIPNYILVKDLGMIDSRLALIIPFGFSAYNMIIVKTYFQSNIPDEMLEAANIDGCSNIRFFFKMALPLAKPVIAVMVLFNGVSHWNGFMRGLLYLNDPAKYTLQQVLRDVLMLSKVSADQLSMISDSQLVEMTNAMELIKYSVIVVGALPMLVLYPFVQKYFTKGMMIGAVKG